MAHQRLDLAHRRRRDTYQDILQVRLGIDPVQFVGLDQGEKHGAPASPSSEPRNSQFFDPGFQPRIERATQFASFSTAPSAQVI